MKNWMRSFPLAAVVMLAACGDDPSGPGGSGPFDPEQSSAEFASVQSAMDANADLADDMAHVAVVFDTTEAAASWVIDANPLPAAGALVEPVRNRRLAIGSSSRPLLPSDLLGKTLEWSDAENGYVVTERPGADPAGIRFILYDRTQTPFVENGFLDVIDQSDPSADRLHVHLEKDGVTRLQYDVTFEQSTSTATVTVDGFLTDGTDRIDFGVLEEVAETADGFLVGIEYTMSLAGRPLSVELDYVLDFGTTITAEFVATFVNGANTLVLDMTQNGDQTIDGTVTWNGELVMTVSDDGEGEPVFLGPEGEALTPEQAAAIQEMFEVAGEGLVFLLEFLVFLGESLG